MLKAWLVLTVDGLLCVAAVMLTPFAVLYLLHLCSTAEYTQECGCVIPLNRDGLPRVSRPCATHRRKFELGEL